MHNQKSRVTYKAWQYLYVSQSKWSTCNAVIPNIRWSILVITTRLLNGPRENWSWCVQ